jgi:hypothetical protein
LGIKQLGLFIATRKPERDKKEETYKRPHGHRIATSSATTTTTTTTTTTATATATATATMCMWCVMYYVVTIKA